MFVLKTEAELTAMTAEQRDAYAVEKQKHDAEQVSKKINEEVEKQTTELKSTVDSLTLQLKEMRENPTTNVDKRKEELVSVMKQLKEICEKGGKGEVIIKTLLQRSGITNDQNAFDLTTIGQLAHRKLSVLDWLMRYAVTINDNNNSGVIRYYDWDENTIARAAASIAEGASFPESTAVFKKGTISIQKIGDSLPVTEEFFEDDARFASELEMFLMTNVDIEIDRQLINGDGTSNTLTGLVSSSNAYTPVASGISHASIYDLCVKVAEDITTLGGAKYMPDTILMNPADANKMKLTKDANYNYVLPPFVTNAGVQIDGMTVIQDAAVTANTMVVFDSRFARIYNKSGVEVSRGLVNAQFTADEETLKVRKRLAFLVRNADKGGFRKVTSISAALTTLAS
jgi:hypothetical protein